MNISIYKQQMGHLFYIYVLLTTILLFGLFSNFFKIKKVQEWYEKFEKITGKRPDKSDFRNEDEYNLYSSISIVSVLEILVLIGGLLTSSWYIYLFLFIFSILITRLLKSIQFSILRKSILFLNQLLRILCYSFLIINHFHLHIDVYQMIKSLHL